MRDDAERWDRFLERAGEMFAEWLERDLARYGLAFENHWRWRLSSDLVFGGVRPTLLHGDLPVVYDDALPPNSVILEQIESYRVDGGAIEYFDIPEVRPCLTSPRLAVRRSSSMS